jgi:hypothetical protein
VRLWQRRARGRSGRRERETVRYWF